MNDTINCPNCQAVLRLEDQYCCKCGANLRIKSSLLAETRRQVSLLDPLARIGYSVLSHCAPGFPLRQETFRRALEIAWGRQGVSPSMDAVLKSLELRGLACSLELGIYTHQAGPEFVRMVKEPDRLIALRAIVDALAEDAFEAALEGFRSDLELLLPHLPVVASWAEQAGLHQAIDLWQYLGNYWFQRVEYRVAQSLYERAYDLSVKLWGERHEVSAICQCNLGKTRHALGEEAAALNCYEAAIPVLLEASRGADPAHEPRLRAAEAFALNDLGALLHKLGMLDSAKKCLLTARLILKDLGGDYTRFLSTVEYHYGMLLCDLEEWHEAQDHLLQALCADGDGRAIEPPEVARIVESLRQVSARLNGDRS